MKEKKSMRTIFKRGIRKRKRERAARGVKFRFRKANIAIAILGSLNACLSRKAVRFEIAVGFDGDLGGDIVKDNAHATQKKNKTQESGLRSKLGRKNKRKKENIITFLQKSVLVWGGQSSTERL